MRKRLICKRCHRLRPIKERGYCAECDSVLREAELPKPAVSSDDGYEEFAQGLIMEHAFSLKKGLDIMGDPDNPRCKCGNPSTSVSGEPMCTACIEKWSQGLATGLVEAGEASGGTVELEGGTVFDLGFGR